VQRSCLRDLVGDCLFQHFWKHGSSIFFTFAGSDNQHAAVAVDILDSQIQAFLKSDSAAIDQHRHCFAGSRKLCKNALNFASGQDNRQFSFIICSDRIEFVFTEFFIENLFIKKNKCVQCLVLGGSRNLALYREIAEVLLNIIGSNLIWRLAAKISGK
jgi:hypothetical protein